MFTWTESEQVIQRTKLWFKRSLLLSVTQPSVMILSGYCRSRSHTWTQHIYLSLPFLYSWRQSAAANIRLKAQHINSFQSGMFTAPNHLVHLLPRLQTIMRTHTHTEPETKSQRWQVMENPDTRAQTGLKSWDLFLDITIKHVKTVWASTRRCRKETVWKVAILWG